MKSARCENCGAGAQPGATVCGYCGTTFVVAAPGGAASASSADPEILRLLRAGNKIGAIKVYHQAHRCSLLDAKNAVEAIERGLTSRK